MSENANKPKTRVFRKYKRGQVVYLNFSPQVGSEMRGYHYAVVLSKNDNSRNTILTVLPLTSKNKRGHLDLGECLLARAAENQKELKVRLAGLDQAIADAQDDLGELNLYVRDCHKKFSQEPLPSDFAQKQNDLVSAASGFIQKIEEREHLSCLLKDVERAVEKLNEHSYAAINLITCIDKRRIKESAVYTTLLKGCVLSASLLDIIDISVVTHLTGLKLNNLEVPIKMEIQES